jgi:methylmalonyl-CoA mutase cobalamin-binding subunit
MIRTLSSRRARPLAAAIAIGLAAVPLLASMPAGAAASASETPIAKAGLITAADLGSGWTSKPYKSSGNGFTQAELKKYPSCATVAKNPVVKLLSDKKNRGIKAQSPEFSKSGYTVDNSTVVAGNETLATQAMAVIASPSFIGCLRDIGNSQIPKVRKQLGSKATDVSASVTPANLQLPVDQESGVALVVSVHLVDGTVVQTAGIFDFARIGRGLVAYELLRDPGAPSEVSVSMLDPSLQRFRTALAN